MDYINFDDIDSDKFYLLGKKENSIEPIMELNKKDFEELEKSIKDSNWLCFILQKAKEYSFSEMDYLQQIPLYEGRIGDNKKFDKILMENIVIDCNRFFIYLCSTFRVYIENSKAMLKQRYGKSSIQMSSFNEFLDKLKIGYFSYNLVYCLRNHILHYPEYPLTIDVTKEKGTKKGQISISLSKDHLELNKEFKNCIGKTLNRFNNKFPVSIFVNELRQVFDLIEEKLFQIIRTEYLKIINDQLEFYNLNTSFDELSIGSPFFENNSLAGWNHRPILYHVLLECKTKFK